MQDGNNFRIHREEPTPAVPLVDDGIPEDPQKKSNDIGWPEAAIFISLFVLIGFIIWVVVK